VAAVFYHLPSLDALGIDVKADLSILLTVFLLSLLVLGALTAGHSAAVALRLLAPRLLHPHAGAAEAFSVVVLNAMNMAIACSTYYSFCGNAEGGAGAAAAAADGARGAVCGRWLRPLPAGRHPFFQPWVIYGEVPANASTSSLLPDALSPAAPAAPPLSAGLALGQGSPQAISPVFTLWLTLLAMFAANCAADYVAAVTLRAAFTSELRRGAAAAACPHSVVADCAYACI
jgi:hypothetical protein